jgi:hypothetical protein
MTLREYDDVISDRNIQIQSLKSYIKDRAYAMNQIRAERVMAQNNLRDEVKTVKNMDNHLHFQGRDHENHLDIFTKN